MVGLFAVYREPGGKMPEYPTATAAAAPLRGLETAIRALGDGIVERRVRRQFHQLLAALEHDGNHQFTSAAVQLLRCD
jgi:hypothetical protein